MYTNKIQIKMPHLVERLKSGEIPRDQFMSFARNAGFSHYDVATLYQELDREKLPPSDPRQ